ncbi:MAG TPA: hypothetical protein P5559_03465 [Candidatus Limiplasma sp.]|nr:hypothetical protein [Candidatus Limiplasma sp.]
MSKYAPLWAHIQADGRDSLALSFAQIEAIVGFPIDHSFLNFKKELQEYGYRAGKISRKEQTVVFIREQPT